MKAEDPQDPKEENKLFFYSKKSKDIFLYTLISIILAFFFIMGPLNQFPFISFLGKIFIICILLYALYENINNTNYLSKTTEISLFEGEWNILKTNIISNYIFTFLLILLLFSVIKKLF